MKFYIPPNMVSDFDTYLASPICKTFKKYRNWFASPQPTVNINAELTDTKTKDVFNFKVSKNADFIKGDYIFDSIKNIYYLCHWQVSEQINAKSTQVKACNIEIKITRDVAETLDNQGMLITPSGTQTIVDTIKGYISKEGAVAFDNGVGEVGVLLNNRFIILVQANPSTLNIKINDELKIWGDDYIVIEKNLSELNNDSQTGIIILTVERKA